VVFLHGWGLGTRAYRRSLRRLIARGSHVVAPALPGLGGTADLPEEEMSLEGYAAWVDEFLSVVGIEAPAVVIGHSFGGGVATKLAHAYPERVGYLVLLNSVGGPADRPIWFWGVRFAREMLPDRQSFDLLLAMRDDLIDNIVGNPMGLIRAGRVARAADLRVELSDLRDRGVPVLALTTDADGVIPQTAFSSLCRAIGTDGTVLHGRHSWLLSDPDTFAEVLGNVVEVRVAGHQEEGSLSRVAEIRRALRSTGISRRISGTMLRNADPLWLMSAPASVLAGDMALLHPRLGSGEVRAIARPLAESPATRLTVVAADRPGLLAETAGVVTTHGLSVLDASAATWSGQNVALHSLTVTGTDAFSAQDWDRLGDALRRSGQKGTRRPGVSAIRARVVSYGAGTDRSLVRVTAPDQRGLLWAVSDWFARHGVSIESLDASTTEGVAHDVFLVTGKFAAADLIRDLSRGAERCPVRALLGLRPRRTGCGTWSVSSRQPAITGR
jgi:pimeloyl-ACP methyl ester carboxylesterase/glycine cleavage system regulatory protein